MFHSILKLKTLLTALIAIPLFFASCSDTDKGNSSTSEAAAASSATPNTSDQKELKDAPDFTLTNINGKSFTLSEHEGKVVVLNIWATWCSPCRKEIPDFVEMQKNMKDKGVLFVGVSVDKEGWEVIRPFAKEYSINYPIVLDDGTVYQKYGPLRGIPTTFIINKKGKVEYVATGMVTKKLLQPVLQKLAAR